MNVLNCVLKTCDFPFCDSSSRESDNKIVVIIKKEKEMEKISLIQLRV